MKEKALRQLRSGESLFGNNGAFAPLLKQFLESAIEGELDAHLDQEERKKKATAGTGNSVKRCVHQKASWTLLPPGIANPALSLP